MERFYFTKLNGSGNDFILFDDKLNPTLSLTEEIIKKLTDRHNGIGCDGVLVINRNSDEADFAVTYYNADGSTGSLCANGSRCIIKYAYEEKLFKGNDVNFFLNGNKYSGEVLANGFFRFNLYSPSRAKLNFKIKANAQLINASYVDTGSPHVVIDIKDVLRDPKNLHSFYDEILDFPIYELGKEIRFHSDFKPDGVNINFIDTKEEIVKIRSYERGVENETLSCGTGSVAAAIIAVLNYDYKPPIKLLVKNGDLLEVDFKLEDGHFSDVSLTGPAIIVFNGEITI
ncbi:MAG: diaminopimelate epimerase [Melioribacteraceae bacterium]|nr:diaminopimelate epimerase [Melioribacteraceae bacterium]